MEIDIHDYLTENEIKDLCIEHVKDTLSCNEERNRMLSNMAYSAAFHILDSALSPDMMNDIRLKVKELIKDPASFSIFRKKDAWGSEDSEAYLEVKQAVAEHKHLINPLVKQVILDKDYASALPDSGEYISDFIIDALKKGLSVKE